MSGVSLMQYIPAVRCATRFTHNNIIKIEMGECHAIQDFVEQIDDEQTEHLKVTKKYVHIVQFANSTISQ